MLITEYDPFRELQDNFAKDENVSSQLVLGQPSNVAPSISIVIPTYRRASLLDDALKSAMNQIDFDDYEVIVVDNDNEKESSATEDVVRRYLNDRLCYYRNTRNLGMTGNWNRGIQLARGRWVTLLHDDDWLLPSYLKTMTPFLLSSRSLVTCRVESGGLSYSARATQDVSADYMARTSRIGPRTLVLGNVSPAPGILLRRADAVAAKGFDNSLYPCADYDFYIRVVLAGEGWVVHKVLAYYRTSDSITFKGETLERIVDVSILIKRYLLSLRPSPASFLLYLESIKRWHKLAHVHGRSLRLDGLLNNLAGWLSRSELRSNAISRFASIFDAFERIFDRFSQVTSKNHNE